MRRRSLPLLMCLIVVLSGCAGPVRQSAAPAPPVLIEMPQTRQATDYTCGVAVVQSILAHNGYLYRQDVLEKRLGATPERGTTPQAIMDCLTEYGIANELVQNMTLDGLRRSIDEARPVICFLQAWNEDPLFDYANGWVDGHYAIAIGYDAGRIYFMDPSTIANYTYIDNDAFLARWHDGNEEFQVYQGGIVFCNPKPVYDRNAFRPML